MKIRTGQGIDFHRLEEGRDLWIGGINIPSRRGCIAHSDGDVLLHAICDALLGAAGLRDIGFHFPDNDPSYKGISSKILLDRTMKLISEKGYSVINIDSTICLENPKISAYVPEMKKVIAGIAAVEPDDVGIKATTTEKMGFTGREEGVVALASVLLIRHT
ncbi:MAG: 2-C-methyl-D-erythritol 2,4-cyclodiphosphate synthase [Bacteroidales bacterium]|jgi:2-C-methyl-D-erythritol 2,4-cyclodiphosphate synthase|nr:2-C-methyl-D-erythritol 2,4-cyclodiphosphate synthase [Bacteroidales bacterium]